MTVVDYGMLSDVKPMKSALVRIKKNSGHNSQGRITIRHRGGGARRLYRVVDFKQLKTNIPGCVEAIEYDPNRTCFILRVVYRDGDRRYVVAPHGVNKGDEIITAENAPLKPGNRLMLKNIPVGYAVHNIELNPTAGGQIVRSAGSQAQVLAQETGYTHIKLPSGEVRKVLANNYATLGQVSNPDHGLMNIGKAGRARHMGIRPTVRGSVMNPCDHPYGGGEGVQPRGTRRPKNIWGKITGGRKTRDKKKWSNQVIVSRRVTRRKKK
jgi:large subunit ribosomal protein L2